MKTVLGEAFFRLHLLAKPAFLVAVVATCLLTACEKEPGKGGLATITGKVFTLDVNALGAVHDSGYGGGIKVSLSYGDHDWVDQSTTTSPSGDYAFEGLQKGDYTVYTYSRCDNCLLNQETFLQAVELTKTRQVATLPDFRIKK